MSFKELNIQVVGLGKSGKSAALLAFRLGANVTATDGKRNVDTLVFENTNVNLELGCDDFIEGTDLLIVSPGVGPHHEAVREAEKKGIKILGEMEFASQNCNTPIIAVTGTDGKSSVVSMVGEVLEDSGFKTWVGGNLGIALSEFLLEESSNSYDWIVLEVSSYNLERIEHFHPKISAILNLAPDHLSRYKSLEDYYKTKMKITSNQTQDDFIVLNADDSHLVQCSLPGSPKRVWFSRHQKSIPGIFTQEDTIYGEMGEDKFSIPLDFGEYCPDHQITNRLSALAIAQLAGCPLEKSIDRLKKHQSLPHRLQLVGIKDGIQFWNDSKATTVHSTEAALKSLPGPVVLIAGGESKEPSFEFLGDALEGKGRVAVLFGRDKEKIKKDIEKDIPVVMAKNLEEAFKLSLEKSSEGDQILLSPACASFDMFENFEKRGELFIDLARRFINGS